MSECFRYAVVRFPYHQVIEVLLQSIVVEALERLSVVKLAAKRIAGGVVLAEDVEPELVGPPVAVLKAVSVGWFCAPRPRRGLTLVPPPPVLATRIGHLDGSSPRLPMVSRCGQVNGVVMVWMERGGRKMDVSGARRGVMADVLSSGDGESRAAHYRW